MRHLFKILKGVKCMIDYKWEELKSIIKIRDNNECIVYRILNKEEKRIVEKQEGFWLQKYIDGAHIVARSIAPHHIYNPDNVVLVGRFFHKRLDDGLDLITGKFIGFDGVAQWWTRIMRDNKYWDDTIDYYKFKEKLLKK